jgi:predicted ABC-type ATPase
MKKLYIISGCNGAGKTTASYTILPEILDCKEFVNTDEIAKGLPPSQPETTGLEAGRLMSKKINSLIVSGQTFTFETMLAARSYVDFIEKPRI